MKQLMKSCTLHLLSSILACALMMSHAVAVEPSKLPPLVSCKLEWNWVGNTHAALTDNQPAGTEKKPWRRPQGRRLGHAQHGATRLQVGADGNLGQ